MKPLTAFALVASLFLAGCGGHGGSNSARPERASAVIRFVWPKAASRLIPLGANSVRIDLSNGPSSVPAKVVTRASAVASGTDSSQVAFTGLQVGTYTVTATAFASADGTGNAQATGSTSVTLSQGVTTTFAITMASQVATGAIVGSSSLGLNKTATYAAHFYSDAAQTVEVLVDPSTVQWTVSGSLTATSATNAITRTVKAAGSKGTGTIAATYAESGAPSVSASLSVTVQASTYTPGGAIGRGSGLPGQGSPSDNYTLLGLAGTFAYNEYFIGGSTYTNDALSPFTMGQANPWGYDVAYPVPGGFAVTPTDQYVYLSTSGQVLGAGMNFSTGVIAVSGMAVDGQHNVYLLLPPSDASSSTAVNVYSSAGSLLRSISGLSSGLVSIGVSPSGTVYVSDSTQTYRLDASGAIDTTFGPILGTQVVVDAQGLLYTVSGSFASSKIDIYDDAGESLTQITPYKTPVENSDPHTALNRLSISVDPSTGVLYSGTSILYPATNSAPSYYGFEIYPYTPGP